MNALRLAGDIIRAAARAAAAEYRAARFLRQPYVQDRLREVQSRYAAGETPIPDPPDLIQKRLRNLGA